MTKLEAALYLTGDDLRYSAWLSYLALPDLEGLEPLQRNLLATLVTADLRAVPRDELIQSLWPRAKGPAEILRQAPDLQKLVSATKAYFKSIGLDVIVSIRSGREVDAYRIGTVIEFQGNIQRSSYQFVGRKHLAQEIGTLLSSGRLVTLTGAPGVGKTRLATEVLIAGAQQFPGGVWIVPLGNATEETSIAGEIGRTLPLPGEATADTLKARLAGKRTAVCLDGFEPLVHRFADIVSLLLDRPELTFVVTTHRALDSIPRGIKEHHRHVRPLEVPAEEETPPDNPAITFFCEVAEAKTGRPVKPNQLSDVAQICRVVGGLPMAIELAAASTRTIAIAQVRDQLEHDFWATLRAAARPGQRTLWDEVANAWASLSQEQSRFIAWLSVFEDGASYDLVLKLAHAIGMSKADFTASSGAAIDLGLLEHPDDERYELLAPIREFGLIKLRELGEEEAARSVHALACLKLAQELDGALFKSAAAAAARAFEAEGRNMRTADLYFARHGDDQKRLELCIAMAWFWTIRVDVDRVATIESALVNTGIGTPDQRALANNRMGCLLRIGGRDEDANRAYHAALDVAVAAGDKWNQSLALNGLGRMAAVAGEVGEARQCYGESVELRRGLAEKDDSYRGPLAGSLDNLADLDLAAEEWASAQQGYLKSHLIRFKAKDAFGLPRSHMRWGLLQFHLSRFDSARRAYRRALKQFIDIGYRDWQVATCEALANLAHRQGDMANAAILCGIAEGLHLRWKMVTSPLDHAQWEQATEALRQALRDEYIRHRRKGRAMNEKDGMAFALAFASRKPFRGKKDPAALWSLRDHLNVVP